MCAMTLEKYSEERIRLVSRGNDHVLYQIPESKLKERVYEQADIVQTDKQPINTADLTPLTADEVPA